MYLLLTEGALKDKKLVAKVAEAFCLGIQEEDELRRDATATFFWILRFLWLPGLLRVMSDWQWSVS